VRALSIASKIQSLIGNVKAGSTFAKLTSIGMKSKGILASKYALVNGMFAIPGINIVLGAGAAIAGGYLVYKYFIEEVQ